MKRCTRANELNGEWKKWHAMEKVSKANIHYWWGKIGMSYIYERERKSRGKEVRTYQDVGYPITSIRNLACCESRALCCKIVQFRSCALSDDINSVQIGESGRKYTNQGEEKINWKHAWENSKQENYLGGKRESMKILAGGKTMFARGSVCQKRTCMGHLSNVRRWR